MAKQYTGTVVEEFQCKLTKEFFPVGSQYVTDDQERIQFLNDAEYVEGATEVVSNPDHTAEDDDPNTEIKHVGGGYYELPNGEKIKGKENAEEALKALKGA